MAHSHQNGNGQGNRHVARNVMLAANIEGKNAIDAEHGSMQHRFENGLGMNENERSGME